MKQPNSLPSLLKFFKTLTYNVLTGTVGDERDVANLMALQDRILKRGFVPIADHAMRKAALAH